jgi:hypothetical protein
MLKKILIGVGIFITIAALTLGYMMYRNKTMSPAGTADISANGLTVHVDYCRPSVRDRVIFGPEDSDAIQPWGVYWRLGANESTEFEVNQDVIVSGQLLKAGRYKIYAFPGEFDFEFGISTDLGKWGYAEPDYSKDVLRFRIPIEYSQTITEQHTISLAGTKIGVNMVIEFEKVKLTIPIQAAP